MKIYNEIKNKYSGFTLMEILVVVAIVGILSSVVLGTLNVAREKAKAAKAKEELVGIRNAIAILSNDTNRWPNGCAVGKVVDNNNNETALTSNEAGLLAAPPVGVVTPDCEWTAAAVNAWSGPYVNGDLVDPWGDPYWFDNDYYPLQDCPTPDANPGVEAMAVIVSGGPDGASGAEDSDYDCDDIYIEIK